MNGLSDYTDQELNDELKKRKTMGLKPEPLLAHDVEKFKQLQSMAKEYIDGLAEDGRPPKDIETYVFEAVIVFFYGEDVWKWTNPILKEG